MDYVQEVSETGTVSYGEYYQDIDGSDSWDSGEPLDDRNGNGVWDDNNTISLGEVLVSVNEDHSLVSGTAVRSDGINYTILKIYEGTNWLLIAGNPIVEEDHTVEVDYIFTEDYSEFLNKLLSSITNY